MALKSTTRKTSKPAASAKTVSTAKPKNKKKPVTRATASSSRTAKASAKAAPAKAAATKPVADTQNVTFTCFAPQAASVLVAGDFTKWETAPISLVKEQSGNWKTTVALTPGKYQYRLLVDGQWQNDPACPEVQPNEFGSANCVMLVA